MRRKRNEASYKRAPKKIRPSPMFLIVCEGEITEVEYFRSFPYYHSLGFSSDQAQNYSYGAVIIEGGAGQYSQVIERAEKLYREIKRSIGTLQRSEVWCVFDCDENIEALKIAVQAAKRKGFNPIYSIQCFELWFLLHYHLVNTAIDKRLYDNKLSELLGSRYSHGTLGMYERLLSRQQTAIRNADRLWQEAINQKSGFSDPLTNVHLLVIALNDAYAKARKK